MSFEITPIAGNVQELNVDLSKPSQHEREEFVIEEVKKAIDHIVTALGGYLSVSCNGNINPISGESGDLVNIYITSLPAPPSAAIPPEPVETQEGVGSPKEVQLKSTIESGLTITASPEVTGPTQQESAPVEQSQELTQPSVIESTPTPTVPPTAPSQPVENSPVVPEQPES